MQIKILIVNDIKLARKLTRRFLEDAGFICNEANDGREALEMIRSEWFDLIITNWHMPHIDGLMLTSHIHKNMNPKPLIILEVFAWSDEINTLAIETGADECYNHSGIEREELLELVNNLLIKKNIIKLDEKNENIFD